DTCDAVINCGRHEKLRRFLRGHVTDGHERCTDSVLSHIFLYISDVIAQFIGRDQIVQGRVLLLLGGLLPSDECQLAARTDLRGFSPGIELGLTDYGKDARNSEIVAAPCFCIRRVALKFVQGITRRVRIGLERGLWLRPIQCLGAIDGLRDGLIRPGGGLESSGGFLRNNRDLAATSDNGGKEKNCRILKTLRFHYDLPSIAFEKCPPD